MKARWSWSLFVVVAALVVGCRVGAAAPVPAKPVDAPTEPEALAAQKADVVVYVQEDPEADAWRVRFELAEPALGLRFLGRRNRFRAAKWTSAEGATWSEQDGFEELRVKSPATTFTVAFATMTDPLAKDYELNLAFSEGSRLLYTGHLAAVPLDADAEGLSYQWRFATTAARNVRLLDRTGAGRLQWNAGIEESARGTYVYFGDIAATEGDRYTTIVDPGMPEWMVASTAEVIPRLFEFYAKDVGTRLDFEPLLLLSWGGGSGTGSSAGGGALPGLLQLSAAGGGFVEPSDNARIRWQHFLAHEMFHLWNSQLFSRRLDHEEEWLAEGSAEYFAERALVASGTLDRDALHRRVVAKANICLTALDGEPLLGHEPPRFSDYYPCGWVLMAYADRVAGDLGDVMAQTFEQAAAREDRTYTTYDFLEAIEVVSKNKRAPEPVSRLLRAGAGADSAAFFARLVDGVEVVDPQRATMDPYDFMTRLAGQLVRCDCADPVRTRFAGGQVTIAGNDRCGTFTDRIVVTEVEGHGVTAAPAKAYGAVLARVARDRPITLTMDPPAKKKLRCRAEGKPKTFTELLRVSDVPGLSTE